MDAAQPASLTVDDFDYHLPETLIAQHPLPERSASRLLDVLTDGGLCDTCVRALPDLLRAGDLVVFNDTRVLRARLYGTKDSGGRVEVLVERLLDTTDALAQVRASKSPKPGTRLRLADAFEVDVLGREGEFFHLRTTDGSNLADRLAQHGELPLPPYIQRSADDADDARYQTVFARNAGSVAAPTAGLHFDDALLAALDTAGIERTHVTLHVGAGTFQPVRVQRLADHVMHAERYRISDETVAAIARCRARGGRVVAVGTTSMRTLEGAAAANGVLTAGAGETRLFITPGFRFRVVDMLLTNFHLPRSTLLMLVSAFAGIDTIRAAYAHAVAQQYRFFSYGDAMLLRRQPDAPEKNGCSST